MSSIIFILVISFIGFIALRIRQYIATKNRRILIGMIRRTVPSLIAKELVSVQPMTNIDWDCVRVAIRYIHGDKDESNRTENTD